MGRRRQISEATANRAKESDLRRLAAWNEKLFQYGEPVDWSKEDREKIIYYLQCQFIIST